MDQELLRAVRLGATRKGRLRGIVTDRDLLMRYSEHERQVEADDLAIKHKIGRAVDERLTLAGLSENARNAYIEELRMQYTPEIEAMQARHEKQRKALWEEIYEAVDAPLAIRRSDWNLTLNTSNGELRDKPDSPLFDLLDALENL